MIVTSTQISPGLEHVLAANPDAQFYLLIRVTQADDRTEQALRECGATIRHRLTLIPTFRSYLHRRRQRSASCSARGSSISKTTGLCTPCSAPQSQFLNAFS